MLPILRIRDKITVCLEEYDTSDVMSFKNKVVYFTPTNHSTSMTIYELKRKVNFMLKYIRKSCGNISNITK